jgi:hypothetical protein
MFAAMCVGISSSASCDEGVEYRVVSASSQVGAMRQSPTSGGGRAVNRVAVGGDLLVG